MRFATVFLLMLATGSQSLAASHDEPQSGWRCILQRSGSFGTISTAFEVSKRPQSMPAYIRWDAGDGTYKNPWVTAAWYRRADGTYNLDNGYIDVMWHIWRNEPGKGYKAQTLRLELRTTLNEPKYGASVIASNFEKSAGPFHIKLNWSDVSALARGSPHLYLMARDKKFQTVDHVKMDNMVFDRAKPHVEAAMRDIEAMYADPSKNCTYFDDLGADDTDEIVVT